MWRLEVRSLSGKWLFLFLSHERTKAAALKDARANVGGYMDIREWRLVRA